MKKYNLTDTQSYDINVLNTALIASGINGGISGHGKDAFTVHSEDPGVEAIVQNHLLTDWDAWRTAEAEKKIITDQLSATDKDVARVGEDLLNLLITKGVITLAEMPQTAQDKINERDTLRGQLV